MKRIKLRDKDLYVIVDDGDYDWLKSIGEWGHLKNKSTDGYARITDNVNKKALLMHRVIMEKYHGTSELDVDHINHNSLDNRKQNLRYGTRSQNNMNQSRNKEKNYSSKYKGVTFIRRGKRWCTQVKNNKNKFFAFFTHEIDAAIAYDIYARKFFGEFACINFPNIKQSEIDRVNKMINNPKKLNGLSIYRGVSKAKNKWRARIRKDGKDFIIGFFYTEEEAALAYNKEAQIIRGEKAKLNII